jgi:peptide chain release factor 1
MLERLQEIAKRHEDLLAEQADPEVAVDPKRSRDVAIKLAELEPVVAAYRDYSTISGELEGAREIVAEADDDEMRDMAEAEVEDLSARLDEVEQQLKILLLPADPNDRRNVILEVRAGTGGEEAALFAAELLRMYGRYAEERRWKMSLTDSADRRRRPAARIRRSPRRRARCTLRGRSRRSVLPGSRCVADTRHPAWCR